MSKVLVVIDMQNDFITGSLKTPEAPLVVTPIVKKLQTFEGHIFFTQDTHNSGYLTSQEGLHLPVPHCIKGTWGHQIHDELVPYTKKATIIEKDTFGSKLLAESLKELHENEPITSIELVGLCTDICVISNALIIKAYLPNVPISVDASCCAGVTIDSHQNALKAMAMCHINIINQ